MADLPTVVAVDDEPDVLALIEAVLRRYAVTTFSDPHAALAALREGPAPDLIISDIGMPGLSGFDLHRALREIPAVRGVPFVFLTAFGDRSNIRQGMVQGADDYLVKPFTPKELREAVESSLARAQRLREAETRELVIVSLGGVGISVGEIRLQWEAKKVVALLLRLLAGDGSARLRDLYRDLWSSKVPLNHLHVLASRLRRTLSGHGELGVEGETMKLSLVAPVRWDAQAFERTAAVALDQLSSGPIERAVRLYAGTFLPDFDEPWAERERIRLEGRYLELLEAAVELAPAGGVTATGRGAAVGLLRGLNPAVRKSARAATDVDERSDEAGAGGIGGIEGPRAQGFEVSSS